MKKLIYGIILCAIAITIIFSIVPKKVQAIELIEVYDTKMKQEQQEWREQYYHKIIFLEKCMYIVVGILICNIILFSILLYKRKKVDLIYKILQIIFLILIYVLYRIWDGIPGEPYIVRAAVIEPWRDVWRPIIIDFVAIEAIVLFITLFVNKKIYIFSGSILIGLLLLIYTILGSILEYNDLEIMPSIVLVIITNILFLPLYLSKKEIKEEENVRI